MARRVARLASVVALVGAVGWIGGPVVAGGAVTPVAAGVVFALSLVVGAVVYLAFERVVSTSLSPLQRFASTLRELASRPSDRLTTLQRRLAHVDTSTPEVADVVRAVTLVLERVDERNRQQAAWLGSVVHDLKTPLAATANALDVVAADDGAWTSPQRELLAGSAQELRALAEHVQAVLDSVRLARDDVPLRRAFVDVRQLVDATVARMPLVREVSIIVNGRSVAEVDAVLLERAVSNLVSNAVRYARSRVEVVIFPGMLRVADDGPGLAAPLEELASPFRSEALQVDGTTIGGGAAGMGLFLARRALELHGGKLVVERTDGAGTTLLAYFAGGAR